MCVSVYTYIKIYKYKINLSVSKYFKVNYGQHSITLIKNKKVLKSR